MRRYKALIGLLSAIVLGGTLQISAQEIPPPPPGELLSPEQQAPPANVKDAISEDFETQTRGPLHEAYAEVFQSNPQPGLLVTKQPPKPIEETPPNVKPEGQDVIWISGYWAWDDENEDFLWISGIWRKPPPGLEWVPGYWADVEGGFRWVSGFWGRPGDNIVYREPPPESRDQQVILDAGADDQFWVPGSWDWQGDQYTWNDGYYAPYQQNWVWVPVRWRWTPRGYIRLAGYWDFRPTVRAMLFAPVVFRPGVLLRPRFVFTPRVVVDPWIALNHFWIRPGYCHYYFGNYYAAHYSRWGFTPYASYCKVGGHWDPVFSYYQAFYRRQGINFHARLDSYNNYFVANANLRPPLNWDAQRRFADEHRGSSLLQTSVITSSLDVFAKGANSRIPLVNIDDRVRLALGQADNRMNKQLLAHRELAERAKRDADAAGKASDLVSWSLPKVDRGIDAKELRLAGSKIDSAVRRDLDGRPPSRKVDVAPRRNDLPPTGGIGKTPPSAPRRDTTLAPKETVKKSGPSQAEMDLIRERFGNDPVRFQQEIDKLWSRRAGEQPSISPRSRPIKPDEGSGSSLQGSGRAGGSGSPDFRLLPRSGGGDNPSPKTEDRTPLSGSAGAFKPSIGAGNSNGLRSNGTPLGGEVAPRSAPGGKSGAGQLGGGNANGGVSSASGGGGGKSLRGGSSTLGGGVAPRSVPSAKIGSGQLGGNPGNGGVGSALGGGGGQGLRGGGGGRSGRK